MIQEGDAEKLADFCEANFDFSSLRLGEEYGYTGLSLCVIDAVFSIGIRYSVTQNVVRSFCDFFNLSQKSALHPPKTIDQLPISDFILLYKKHGISEMADKAFRNRNRTSSRSGILKAEAVLLFSIVLKKFKVEYLQDIDKVVGKPAFEKEIQLIPGQKSGISLRYFYMLSGKEDYIKPDRMIIRFIEAVIGKSTSIEDASVLLVDTCALLKSEHPSLSPRLLDNLIWSYQRENN